MSVCLNPLECEDRLNTTDFVFEYTMLELGVPQWIALCMKQYEYLPWMGAMFGSILVGLSGVLPLLVIQLNHTDDLKQGGGIEGHPSIYSGILILSGLIVFVITEKVFSVISKIAEEASELNVQTTNNNTKLYNGDEKTDCNDSQKHIAGYLNLLANSIDNFTHGLSLGGAFLVSSKIGCLTTIAILVHEIPHEVGDFAILLKSGFSRWDAARFQLITATGGLIGSFIAISCSGATNALEARTSWILPFTAGTFLHIALVTVLPDLLKEEDPKESLKQFSALILGIVIMAAVTVTFNV